MIWLNVSYGWPLHWWQYDIVQGDGGMAVIGERVSRNRLVANLFLWLAMLAAPAAATECLVPIRIKLSRQLPCAL